LVVVWFTVVVSIVVVVVVACALALAGGEKVILVVVSVAVVVEAVAVGAARADHGGYAAGVDRSQVCMEPTVLRRAKRAKRTSVRPAKTRKGRSYLLLIGRLG
jgi:hypothetical protein